MIGEASPTPGCQNRLFSWCIAGHSAAINRGCGGNGFTTLRVSSGCWLRRTMTQLMGMFGKSSLIGDVIPIGTNVPISVCTDKCRGGCCSTWPGCGGLLRLKNCDSRYSHRMFGLCGCRGSWDRHWQSCDVVARPMSRTEYSQTMFWGCACFVAYAGEDEHRYKPPELPFCPG